MNGYNGDSLPTPYEGGYSEVAPYGGGYRYPGGQYAENESGETRRMLAALRDKMWWILAFALIGGAAGYAYSTTQSPTYRTSATVWLDSGDPGGPFRPSDVLSGNAWGEVFNSNAVVQPVALDFELYAGQILPEEPTGLVTGFELLEGFRPGGYKITSADGRTYQLLNPNDEVLEEGAFADGVGATRGFQWFPDGQAIAALDEPLWFRLNRPEAAARRLSSSLTAMQNERSGIIRSEFVWPDPQEAADLHNAIVQSFIQTTLNLTRGRLREQVEILEQQTNLAASQLRTAELSLEEFRVDAITQPGEPAITTLPDGGRVQDPVFGGYFAEQANLDQIRTDLSELDAILSDPSMNLNIVRLRLVPSIQDYPTITATIANLDQLNLQVRTLLYTYTAQAPQVVELTDQIRDIHDVQLPALISELQADLVNRAQVLEGRLAEQTEQLREIPVRTIEQARLQRRATLAEQLHGTLLSRLETARLAETTALATVQELDSAFVPGRPLTQTLPAFFVLLGSLVGMGVAVGAVLLRDRVDQRIRHPEEISDKFGLPLLGVVPQLRSPDSNRAAAAVAVESFRSIRTQLSHADGGAGGLVLITSSTPREGKSVVAANLAISYASSGMRTLLIDADVRRGRLHSVFNFPRSPGLSEHLAGGVPLDQVVRRHDTAELDIICSGALSSDAELIGGETLAEFLANAQETYDVVVLDGPPLAAGADALILGELCDKVVMVFRAGATSEGMARTRLGMLGNVDLPIVGAVLNAVPEHAPYYDQYVNYYYYAEAEAS